MNLIFGHQLSLLAYEHKKSSLGALGIMDLNLGCPMQMGMSKTVWSHFRAKDSILVCLPSTLSKWAWGKQFSTIWDNGPYHGLLPFPPGKWELVRQFCTILGNRPLSSSLTTPQHTGKRKQFGINWGDGTYFGVSTLLPKEWTWVLVRQFVTICGNKF